MNCKYLAATLVAISMVAVACGDATTNRQTKLEKVYNEKFGGLLERPTALKGIIGFIDCESGLGSAEIERVRDIIAHEMRFNYKIVQSKAKAELPGRKDVDDAGLSVAVFVVSCPSLPPMLAAPEERWTLVNVQRLKEGLPDNVLGERVFAARCRNEILRAFALACGSWTSQYPDNILTATSVADLDCYNPDKMVFDMVQRCTKYLASIGVTPSRKASYQVACKEGWAPLPTNDIQRAIWDKVHEIPSEPIKIKYQKTDDNSKNGGK